MVFGAVDPAASPESRALAPGTLLHEYRIDKVLGAGAFGVTYKATDMNLSIPVAIKEFMPEDLVHRGADGNVTLNDSSHEKLFSWARGRFIGEAQVLAQFRHPNIVRVSRYFGDRGTAYFVMDYAEGKSLERCAAWAGPHPDERRLVEIFIPVMEGLREVHRKKYLHRDIKPANIYLREDDTAMLIDFGAAMLEISHSSDELANVLTHGYAPPEQYARSARQGPQSDIYSLGATLYRLLSEQRPVPANRRRTRILAGEPDPQPPAREIGRGRFSEQFLELVDWMLELDMERRPRSVDDVLHRMPKVLEAGRRANLAQHRGTVQHKLVFAGPVGAGKTTLIRTLSDVPPVVTDARASDMTRQRKEATTVAMDYGVMDLGGNQRVHLYGAPGQERFDFMWEILRKGSLGLVLLIDNSRRDPFADLDFFLHAFRDFVADAGLAIGITRRDIQPSPGIADYHRHLAAGPMAHLSPPIFSVDARRRRDVAMLVQALLISIDPGVDDYDV